MTGPSPNTLPIPTPCKSTSAAPGLTLPHPPGFCQLVRLGVSYKEQAGVGCEGGGRMKRVTSCHQVLVCILTHVAYQRLQGFPRDL